MQALFGELARAEPTHFWFATAFMAVLGIVALVYGFVQFSRARLLENLPTSRLRSAAQGYVELHGHARLLPGPEITAPLSGARCCWWDYRVEERRTVTRGGKRQTEWVVIDRGTSDDLFLLDDGSGECAVDPVGAKVIPSLKRSWRGYHPRPQGPPRERTWFHVGNFRYHERLIQFGDPLYAIGHFQTQIASRDDNESRDVADLLAAWKRDRPQLMQRFDADGDGQIDLQEWEAARREAVTQVRGEQVQRSIQPDLNILNQPKDRRPYILSTRSEAQLTSGLRWTGLACIALGVLGGAGTTLALIARGLLSA